MISLTKKVKFILTISALLSIVYILKYLLPLDKEFHQSSLQRDMRNWWIGAESNKDSILNDELLGLHRSNKFPSDLPCQYTSLRKPLPSKKYSLDYTGMTCVPRRPTPKVCKKARKLNKKPSRKPITCPKRKYKELCRFENTGAFNKYKLHCDWSICKKRRISVGEMNAKYGKVIQWRYSFSAVQLKKALHRSIKNGFYFIFFKCGSLKQVLQLPHNVPKSLQSKNQINVNIVLIDSISRAHFYRSLPRTVNALRDSVYNRTIEATVLDFELFQSLSQHTADNCRPLFSGVTAGVYEDFTSNARESIKPLGIPVLFGNYKKRGYYTIFQEEGCWYDEWGITVTDYERKKAPRRLKYFRKWWKELNQKWKSYFIDDLGMTHFSCQVFAQFHRSNDYDQPKKVCYNGDFITTYYMKYYLELLKSMRRHDNKTPSLHYMHLETGHDYNGARIQNDDLGLANYVTEIARDPNTLTILLSDHGHTRTKYGNTVEGRFELFDPFMFVILPENVANILGKQRVSALVENQRRLFTTADVHKMLMAIPDPEKVKSADYNVNGLLSLLPGNRTCKYLPLTPMARCKCDGSDQRIEDNSKRHVWLAEFAIGKINNMIQKQFMKGARGKFSSGYGSCVRLQGISTTNNLEQQSTSRHAAIMDIVTASPIPNSHEVFQVMVKMPAMHEPQSLVKFIKFDRLSPYSRYSQCADKGVDVKLCACVSNITRNAARTTQEIKEIASRSMFGTRTSTKQIDKAGCLLLMTRTHNYSVSYEVTNICQSVYKVRISGEVYNMFVTEKLPLTTLVMPRTIHYLLSATRYVMSDSYFDIKTSYKLVTESRKKHKKESKKKQES